VLDREKKGSLLYFSIDADITSRFSKLPGTAPQHFVMPAVGSASRQGYGAQTFMAF